MDYPQVRNQCARSLLSDGKALSGSSVTLNQVQGRPFDENLPRKSLDRNYLWITVTPGFPDETPTWSLEDAWRRRRRGFLWARQLSHHPLYIYHTCVDNLKKSSFSSFATQISTPHFPFQLQSAILYSVSRILHFTCFSPDFDLFCDHVELREH